LEIAICPNSIAGISEIWKPWPPMSKALPKCSSELSILALLRIVSVFLYKDTFRQKNAL